MKNDVNGDGKADIVVSSPWGMGIMSLNANSLVTQTMIANGTRLGQWVLDTGTNSVASKADFDGDGKTELLMTSPWGIGILKLMNGVLQSVAIGANGTRLGGWIINTADNQFLHTADFDGDGKEEILLSSPWGLGILKLAGTQITSLMLSPNGTRFGGWLLGTGENYFTLVGDFDGDGKTEILVTSPWGLGILKFFSTTLTSLVMAPNGTRLGDWTLDTTTDRFEVATDLDGDRKAEIVVTGNNKLGILKLRNNTLSSLLVTANGNQPGGWTLDSKKDNLIAGDFDGDGKSEILITSNWGLGVLKFDGEAFTTTVLAQNGTRFGNWLLNTRDNKLNYVSDFDGDGKSEILITSPWGIGVLKQGGNTLTAGFMAPNGTRFGGWLLNTGDNDWEAGIGQSFGVIIYHDQWGGAVANTTAFLRSRGYIVHVTSNAADGIALVKRLSLYLKPGDRIFIYLAGHGDGGRAIGNMDKALAVNHGLQFNDGSIVRLDQFSPSFELMGNKGVDLIVFDGSCWGGETVFNAMGERYCALATTGVFTPGITNTPDPSDIMKLFGKPWKFGLWWSQHATASLLTHNVPHRFYQKIYRNDSSEIARLSLFYKPAIDFYKNLDQGGWDLRERNCYLYRYIYPTEYAALPQERKDLLTGSAQNFTTAMRNEFNGYQLSVVPLKTLLTNSSLVNNASNIYAANFARAWQTIFGDMNWNVVAEPGRHSSYRNVLVPGSYVGQAGFIRMVNEILNMINLLVNCYNRQEALLLRMDETLKASGTFNLKFKNQPLKPRKITDYLKFNEFVREKQIEQKSLMDFPLDRMRLFSILATSPAINERRKTEVTNFLTDNIGIIKDKIKVKLPTLITPSMEDLVAGFRAISEEEAIYLDKTFFLLTIVEEAISNVQSVGASPGDLVNY